ncbi:MAG: low molecular weight phosphatase family protein [bacterium]|nr:low molecular weight phosphatase family protein [bacterium]
MKILVVCLGNTCRSPMFAEMLKRHFNTHGHTNVDVESAGILKEAAGQPAAPDWVTLQSETGVDLSAHRSRWIGNVDVSSFDIIYCVDKKAFEEVYRMTLPSTTKVVLASPSTGGILNPWQKGVDAYRECFSHICDEVKTIRPPS